MSKRIAERLLAFRTFRGLSQRELAKMSGVSYQSICRIEKGADTSLSTIQKLEQALNVKLY